MTRKLIALLLALMLCLSSVSAMAAVTEPGTFPFTDEPAELTIWAGSFAGQQDYDVSVMTKWFEEQTGIHVNWIQAGSSELATLFNTSIASGDWPDIYMYALSGAEYLQFAEDGVLLPLNDLIEKNGYYIKQAFEDVPGMKEAITAPDGNIYGMPLSRYAYAHAVQNKLWVYKEWLDAYTAATGKGNPDTPAALKDMLIYFRDHDMNGNGDPSDEIVMTGNYNWGHEGGNPAYYLLNAFCFVPSAKDHQCFYITDDGKFTTDVTSDAYREGLRYIHDLYNEGLFGEEIFVQDLNSMRALTTTTKDSVIVATAGAPYSLRLVTAQTGVENAVTFDDYVPVNPLKNVNTGVATYPTQPADKVSMSNFITTACDTPDLAMRWLDFFYSDDVQNWLTNYGLEGQDWDWVDSPSLGGDAKSIRVREDARGLNGGSWNGGWCGVWYQSRDLMLAGEAATATTGPSWAAHDLYYANSKNNNVPFIVWCDDLDVVTEYTEMQTLLRGYIETAMSEFVLGVRDIDSDEAWNEYIAELNRMGLEDFIEIATVYYGL